MSNQSKFKSIEIPAGTVKQILHFLDYAQEDVENNREADNEEYYDSHSEYQAAQQQYEADEAEIKRIQDILKEALNGNASNSVQPNH